MICQQLVARGKCVFPDWLLAVDMKSIAKAQAKQAKRQVGDFLVAKEKCVLVRDFQRHQNPPCNCSGHL